MSFNPSNVKVHFAGYDNDERAIAVLKAAGVRYRLFTSYPFIKGRSSDSDMRVPRLAEMDAGFQHVIMDSGLFTMMFDVPAAIQLSRASGCTAYALSRSRTTSRRVLSSATAKSS